MGELSANLIAVLIFTTAVVVIEVVVILESNTEWDHQNIVRFIGLTLIVGAAFALVMTWVKGEYLTSVTGLLGTVAGHFLRPQAK